MTLRSTLLSSICLLLLGIGSTAAEDCDPATSAFCSCETDSDCIRAGKPKMAGVCNHNQCSNKFAPWTPQISGLTEFCQAYVNGCRDGSLTLFDSGKRVEVKVAGPGAFNVKECSIEVKVGSSSVRAGSAERLADSVSACLHNAPVYFYETAKEARKDSASCCSFDWNYKPPQRQASR